MFVTGKKFWKSLKFSKNTNDHLAKMLSSKVQNNQKQLEYKPKKPL